MSKAKFGSAAQDEAAQKRAIWEKTVLEAAERIRAAAGADMPALVAIDGRCAAGKTTLAEKLREMTGCTVFHMDDFFLRPGQRSRERLDTPGGNVDYERFLEEILEPLKNGAAKIVYRPYDCHAQELLPPVVTEPAQTVLIEGSYSCHPRLWDYYSLRLFMTVGQEEQLRRIALRGGEESVRRFREMWIPMEEKYFAAYRIRERCDAVLSF